MAEDILLQDFFDDELLEMIEKQSEYLPKLPIEPTVANPVYTNGQTEETKHVEEASSSMMKSWKCLWTSKKIVTQRRKQYPT